MYRRNGEFSQPDNNYCRPTIIKFLPLVIQLVGNSTISGRIGYATLRWAHRNLSAAHPVGWSPGPHGGIRRSARPPRLPSSVRIAGWLVVGPDRRYVLPPHRNGRCRSATGERQPATCALSLAAGCPADDPRTVRSQHHLSSPPQADPPALSEPISATEEHPIDDGRDPRHLRSHGVGRWRGRFGPGPTPRDPLKRVDSRESEPVTDRASPGPRRPSARTLLSIGIRRRRWHLEARTQSR